MIRPAPITPQLIEACRLYSPHAPVSVRHEPDGEAGRCYDNVFRAAQREGLNTRCRLLLGWWLWTWGEGMIDAVYHAVLKRPDGLLCVTPRPNCDVDAITFLPHQESPWGGSRTALDAIRAAGLEWLTIDL